MLVLMCHAGENRYAIDAASVIEVLPAVQFHTVAESPPWLSGVFALRGTATPLVDLTELLTATPCPLRWNSRIVLARTAETIFPTGLGLLTERVTPAEIDTQATATSAQPSAVTEALGPMLLDEQGLFQLIDLARLLSPQRLDAMQSVLADEMP